MDPKEIAALLASGEPEKIKAAQNQLQALGYDVKPDGKLGRETSLAMAKYREDVADTAKVSRDTAIAQNEASDPLRNAINMGVEVGPYVAGALTGAGIGHYGAQGLAAKDARAAQEVGRIAKNPAITSEAANAQLDKLNRARYGRTGAQFLGPAAAFGTAELLRRYVAPNFDKETQKYINLGANLDQGIGVGLGLHQLIDLKNRVGAPWDAEDEAIIRSRGVPPDTPPAAPAAPSAKPGSRTDLYNQAKARGLPVNSKTRKADIEKLLSEALKKSSRAAKKLPKAIVPLAAGYGVYDALRSPAEASQVNPRGERSGGDGETPEPMSRGEAAAYGGAAAGGTALAGTGLKRLADAVARRAPAIAGTAGRIAGRVLPPVAAGLTAYDAFQGIDQLAHLSPPQDPGAYSTMGAFMPPDADPAYAPESIGQVPERNPARVYENAYQPGGQPTGYGGADTMPNGSVMTDGDMNGGGELDSLIAAAEQDPEMAAMIRDLIQARIGGSVAAQ